MEMTTEQEKQEDCSCPACGCSDFDGYCGSCKHKADKGTNWYTDKPATLQRDKPKTKITEKQQEELNELLAEDISIRYNNSEYWDTDLTMEYYANNNIEKD